MKKNKVNYTTKRIEKSIPVADFLKDYVDIQKFLKFCKNCENYNKVWSCPEYDFNPMDIWNNYKNLEIVVIKVIYDDQSRSTQYSKEELIEIGEETLLKEKEKLLDEYLLKEKDFTDSLFLAAGSCDICSKTDGVPNCAKQENKECRFPEKMRYSIESLGGDVVKTAKEIFDIEIKWSEDSTLPEYYILMCGMLKK